jgi:hypothetical protein
VLTTIGSLCVLGAAVLFLPALLYAAAHMRVKKETARIEAKKTTKPESKSPMKGDKEGL